ncbi:MAG: Cys-tRNA(Pro) deacylase [Thomasclavelia sp.]|jgi:Cys-tRNA(Pro)/Cys-tRNA(Cys) deacylase|nr:Cys-tRNA(Pro) deacylase [Thomasclavelia sp.]
MKKKFKTNALRILDKNNIAYEIKDYEYDEEHLSGEHIINQVGLPSEMIFKTLVLVDNNKNHLVCCIPVLKEIDLKALAKFVGVKSVSMIHVKELLNLTGYIRGGCSPVGMKKDFLTIMDESIMSQDKIAFSAGKRGHQMIVGRDDILKITNAKVGKVTY